MPSGTTGKVVEGPKKKYTVNQATCFKKRDIAC